MTRESVRLEVANASRDGTLALISPVTTSTDGRWVAITRWMPAARASWVMRTMESSTSRGATIIRSASSSTITSRYGYGWTGPWWTGSGGRSWPLRTALLKSSTCRNPYAASVVVAAFHLPHHPLQRLGGLLGAGDDRGDQVRDALVDGQFDPLRVDEDHADLLGVARVRMDVISPLTATDLPEPVAPAISDVRHLRDIRDNGLALDVLAEPSQHRMLVGRRGRGLQDITERDGLPVLVGDLDADRGLAGDRGDDPHVGGLRPRRRCSVPGP